MTTKQKSPNRGKPLNCWMRDEDMRLIRDLATFLSSRGYRVSDSQVIKAALRVAKPDGKFIKEFEHVMQMDGRFKRD
jgi:hypothetical protein